MVTLASDFFFFLFEPSTHKKTRLIKRYHHLIVYLDSFLNTAIMNSHNAKLPVWMLTPMEEKEARKRWKEYAYKQCDEVVQSEYQFNKKSVRYQIANFP